VKTLKLEVLGDDILFGGDDEITDTLTGGGGKDIFILN